VSAVVDYYGSNYSLQSNLLSILDKISSGEIRSRTDFLSDLVREVVLHDRFNILGGRVWQLIPEEKAYRLIFQYGSVKKVPHNYQVSIHSDPKFKSLADTHTMISEENDPVLLDTGIMLYSMAGAGETYPMDGDKYFGFILSFNAPEITRDFYETLSVISSFASIRLHETKFIDEREMIEKSIKTASKLQRDLLPDGDQEFSDYKIYGECIQSGGDNHVGGDYFDYFLNNSHEEERLGVLISDAASKGIPAAVQSAYVSGAVKMAQSFSPKISSLLSHLNKLVFDTFPFERPVSLFYCELTLSSNRLVLYANAGHSAPIHYRPSTGNYQNLNPTGGLLGILQKQKYVVENVRMLPGDVMCLYTDGITEASNEMGDMFGVQRLRELLRTYCELPPKEITKKIFESVESFASTGGYNDDRTLIIIKRDVEAEL
jgi:sigma-B regulation protein RsbU (phosphoserine phosphatase)